MTSCCSARDWKCIQIVPSTMPAADLLGHCGPHSWLLQSLSLMSSGLQTLAGRIFPFLRQKAPPKKVRQAVLPNACWTSDFKLAPIRESPSPMFGLNTVLTFLIPTQVVRCGKAHVILSCRAKCCNMRQPVTQHKAPKSLFCCSHTTSHIWCSSAAFLLTEIILTFQMFCWSWISIPHNFLNHCQNT